MIDFRRRDFIGVAGEPVFALGGVYLGDDVYGAVGGDGALRPLCLYGGAFFPRRGSVGFCLAASEG